MMADGKSQRQIATALNVAQRTITNDQRAIAREVGENVKPETVEVDPVETPKHGGARAGAGRKPVAKPAAEPKPEPVEPVEPEPVVRKPQREPIDAKPVAETAEPAPQADTTAKMLDRLAKAGLLARYPVRDRDGRPTGYLFDVTRRGLQVMADACAQ